jgi:hypothetical protein
VNWCITGLAFHTHSVPISGQLRLSQISHDCMKIIKLDGSECFFCLQKIHFLLMQRIYRIMDVDRIRISTSVLKLC